MNRINKTAVIIGSVLLAVLPWMGGGRDPLAVLVSVFGLLLAAFLLMRRSNLPGISTWPLRVVTLAWLVWAAASLIWSVNRYDTEQWLLYALIAIIVFILSANLTLQQKLQLQIGYIWVATLAAIYGLYLFITGDYERLTSSFYWANPCAAFLLPAFIMSLWKCVGVAGFLQNVWKLAEWRHWLVGAQVILLGTAFWLTDSRGAIQAGLIILLVALAFRPVRRRAGIIALTLVVTFGLALGIAQLRTAVNHQSSPAPGSRFTQAAQGESTSGSDRFNYLGSALHIWQEHPLLGTGAGTFGTLHPQYQQNVTSAGNDPHNILAKTLAEQGLIGALLLCYVALILAWGVWRGIRREPRMAPAALGALALTLHFMVDIDVRYPALIALLALLVGTTYQPWLKREVHGYRRLYLPVALILALILSIGTYLSSVWAERGSIHNDNHDISLAAEAYGRAHAGLVYNPDTWTAEGIDYYTLARFTGGSKRYLPLARDRAHQAIARDQRDSQHYFLLGRIERLSGNDTKAVTAYRKALGLDQWNHPEYYLDLALTLAHQGDRNAALKEIKKVLALYPPKVVANRHDDPTIAPTIRQLRQLQAELAASKS